MLRPTTEKPINYLQDAFDRGTNIWAAHLVPDPSKPDEIDQYYLKHILNPAIKVYVEANGMKTFPVHLDTMPDYLWDDIKDNGASAIFPVSLCVRAQYSAPCLSSPHS